VVCVCVCGGGGAHLHDIILKQQAFKVYSTKGHAN
jgi:hypothetical protein